jgi:outer membrane protein OmpA-like peptidoglycan-associated protein
MRRFKKIALGIIIFFAIYTIVGFLILPAVIKNVAVKKLSQTLHRQVIINEIKLNPYVLCLTVNGFTIKERKGQDDFIHFDRMYLNLQGISIFKRAAVIKEFRLESPFVKFVRNTDGSYNFSDLLNSSEPVEPTTIEKKTSPVSWPVKSAIYNIQILNARADILDKPMSKTHKITDMELTIPFLSSLSNDIEVFVQPHFSANLNGKPILLVGKTKPFSNSLETVFDIEFNGIDLPYYFAYLPVKTNFQISSGLLDTTISLSYIQPKKGTPTLSSSGDLIIKDLEIKDISNRSLLKLSLFNIAWLRSRLLSGDIHLTKVLFKAPEINITRNKKGMINIHSLFPATETEQDTPEEEGRPITLAIDEIKVDDSLVSLSDFSQIQDTDTPEQTDILKIPTFSILNTSVNTAQKEFKVKEVSAEQGLLMIRRLKDENFNIQALFHTKEQKEKPANINENDASWLAAVNKLSIDKFTVKGQGLASKHDDGNLTLDEISIDGSDISTQTNTKGKITLSCKLNESCSIGTAGEFSINPLIADLKMEINDLKLAWFQPFLASMLEIIISDGKFSTSGTLSLSQTKKQELKMKYKGNANVEDFVAKDNIYMDDLVNWKRLLAKGVDIGTSPSYISLEEIAVEELYSRIIINEDGSLNVQNIVTADTEKSSKAFESGGTQIESGAHPSEPKDSETMPINIGKIVFKKGKINFSDRSISPTYSANLVDIQGYVSGLMSKENQRADVSFEGKLEGYAPLEITGTVNPFTEDLFVDIRVRFKDVDLSPVSPYSGKYVGYKIQKGKLSLDLDYLIDQQKLDSTNDVYINQFNFGESVESPDALNLPVKLAVSLLKDRKGQISLHLPVTGRIDDPEFSVSKIILKMLKNILVKAATSPFSLISSVLDNDEDLSFIEFDAGSSELSNDAKTKLDALTKALYERPELELEISGFVDIEKDEQGLISHRFNRRIKAQKFKNIKKEETAPKSVDSVIIEPEEYEKYLKMAYKAGEFEKPKNFLGMTKDIPVPEMEALILKDIKITEDDLRILAKERAQAVKNYILEQDKVEPHRLFLVKPTSLTPEETKNLTKSCVKLSLK